MDAREDDNSQIDERLGDDFGRKAPSQQLREDAMEVGSVDHDLVAPLSTDARELFNGEEWTRQKYNVPPVRVRNGFACNLIAQFCAQRLDRWSHLYWRSICRCLRAGTFGK